MKNNKQSHKFSRIPLKNRSQLNVTSNIEHRCTLTCSAFEWKKMFVIGMSQNCRRTWYFHIWMGRLTWLPLFSSEKKHCDNILWEISLGSEMRSVRITFIKLSRHQMYLNTAHDTYQVRMWTLKSCFSRFTKVTFDDALRVLSI